MTYIVIYKMEGKELFLHCEIDKSEECDNLVFWREKAYKLNKDIATQIRNVVSEWKTVYFMLHSLYHPCLSTIEFVKHEAWKTILGKNLYRVALYFDPTIDTTELYYAVFREDLIVTFSSCFDCYNKEGEVNEEDLISLTPFEVGYYLNKVKKIPKLQEFWKKMCYNHYSEEIINYMETKNYYKMYITLNSIVDMCNSSLDIRKSSIWKNVFHSYNIVERLKELGLPKSAIHDIFSFSVRRKELKIEEYYEKTKYAYYLLARMIRFDIRPGDWIDNLNEYNMRVISTTEETTFVLVDNPIYPYTYPLTNKEIRADIKEMFRKYFRYGEYTISDMNNGVEVIITS